MPEYPQSVMVDITGKVPLEGRHHISAWVFPPNGTTLDPVPLLWCLPGGSYSKAYWHMSVPGHAGYSFAEYFARLGALVIAADHIGTGESSRHPRATELVPHVVAAGNAVAFQELCARAQYGNLLPNVAALRLGPCIGVGHSMGAMLTIIQQSRHASFDAIAALGFGNAGPIVSLPGADETHRATAEEVMQLADSGALDQPFSVDRADAQLRHHFYEDVPEAVIAADDLSSTHLPGVTGPLSIVPFIVADHAARLRCPVFIGLGERDSTPSHYDEPKAYRCSTDITLYILRGSAHCHNTANTRRLLWDRLAGWIRGLPFADGSEPVTTEDVKL